MDTLTFYKSRNITLSQRWRWRYQAQGNSEKLAHGGEGFTSLDACINSACRVVGIDPMNVSPSVDGTPPVTRCDGCVIQPVFK